MKTLEQFKKENQDWLESIISDYVANMEWAEEMNFHPSDYFIDTLFMTREKCNDDNLVQDVQAYIESEVVKRLSDGKTN